MKHLSVALLASLAVGTFAPAAGATNYSLWIHGRNTGTATTAGRYTDFSYWGSSSTSAGVNKKAVNWSGTGRISTTNSGIRDALDCYCTGSNWCYVAAHSAGDLQIGYALAQYGGTTRSVRNASPSSSGVCGTTGSTQTGWNIKWVDVAAGAGGGSELADLGYWATSDALTNDLITTAARALYDHNTTRSKYFYMFAGASGTVYSGVLPGQDDEAVGYHSSGGVSGAAGASLCNPSDYLCNDLNTGTSANEGGSVKWSYHSVDFRDDGEAYSHSTGGAWGGVTALVRADMVTYAL